MIEEIYGKIKEFNLSLNHIVWGLPIMIAILAVGLYLNMGTRFIQIRLFKKSIKESVGRIFEKSADNGSISPFESVCTALSATIGTGNIAGVAGAIAIGGPGAIFWMWISAILGMAVKLVEVVLAVEFRQKNSEGEYIGGPMYYIKNGLHKNFRFLAFFFSLFGVFACFGMGNAVQINTISVSVCHTIAQFADLNNSYVTTIKIAIGMILAIFTGLVLLGGIKKIGKITSVIVPVMTVLFVGLSITVVVKNFSSIPHVFMDILKGAFNPASVTGGVIGSALTGLQIGTSRGIFSNEAGLGTSSIAHACTSSDNPLKQGFFGIFEVFLDTIVICTLTAVVILSSGTKIDYGTTAGPELTIEGLATVFGKAASPLMSIMITFFAFATVIGWGLYGARFIEYLLGIKAVRPFYFIYSALCIFGAVAGLDFVWQLSETFNGLMAIPNLIALILLSGTAFRIIRRSEKQLNKK